MRKIYFLRVPIRLARFALNLNVYRNTNGFKLGKIKKAYDMVIKRCIAEQIGTIEPMGKVSLHFEFIFKDKRRQDLGNWSSIVRKFFEDTIVNMGIIPDDDYKYVVGDGDSFGGIGEEMCIITIKEIEVKG